LSSDQATSLATPIPRTSTAWLAALVRAAAFPVGVGIASRLFSSALIALAGAASTGRWPHLVDANSPFAAWDGQWFLRIAATGYHADAVLTSGAARYHDFAFFPIWPVAIRLSSLGVLPMELTSVLLANLLWVAAMIPALAVLRGITRDEASARRGLLLLALGPAAYVGSLAYSEPLFLLLVALALLQLRHPLKAPLLTAAAQLTRLTGSALSFAALAASVHGRRRTVSGLLTMIAGPAAFLAWVGFIWWLTGEPLGYMRGSPDWYEQSGTEVGLLSVLHGLVVPSTYSVVSIGWVVLLMAAGIAALRTDIAAGTYACATIAATLLLASWVNMPRHALVALPAFAILGRWLPPGRVGRVLIALCAASQAVLVLGAIRWASFPP
jgi:hypothetical protein